MKYSFYNPISGEFLARIFEGSQEGLDLNTPDGSVVMQGEFDCMSQRVNLKTLMVESFQPASPGDDYIWEKNRWVRDPGIVDKEREAQSIQATILALEAQQARPMREAVLNPDNSEALDRIIAIDEQIKTLRATKSEIESENENLKP